MGTGAPVGPVAVRCTALAPTRFGSTITLRLFDSNRTSVTNGPVTPASTLAGGRLTSAAVTAITAVARATSATTVLRRTRKGPSPRPRPRPHGRSSA